MLSRIGLAYANSQCFNPAPILAWRQKIAPTDNYTVLWRRLNLYLLQYTSKERLNARITVNMVLRANITHKLFWKTTFSITVNLCSLKIILPWRSKKWNIKFYFDKILLFGENNSLGFTLQFITSREAEIINRGVIIILLREMVRASKELINFTSRALDIYTLEWS